MILYTCPARTHGADAPLIKHPCGVAASVEGLGRQSRGRLSLSGATTNRALRRQQGQQVLAAGSR